MSADRSAGPTPNRLVAVVVVCALLVLAGVGNSLIRARHRAAAAGRLGPDTVVSLARRVSSLAWYCAGPLQVGPGSASAVVLANASGQLVKGELLVAGTSGAPTSEPVSVAAGATASYPLRSPAATDRPVAATVLLDASGVGVEEIAVPGAHAAGRAPLVAPCATRASATTYLAAGGSKNADNVSLALYDPGATPAVANVSVATSTGPVAPPSLQGVAVGAGQVVVLDISRAVPGRAMIATTVQASGGELVAGELLTAARGHGVETALLAGTPTPASTWDFPPVPAGPSTAEAFAVLDPGARPARVVLDTSGTGGPAKTTATVPAGGVIAIATGSVPEAGAVRSAEVTVTSGPPVVVARELVLEQPLAAARADVPVVTVRTTKVAGHLVHRRVVTVHVATGGPAAPTLLPALPPGYAVGAAVTRPARTWVLPAGRADATTGEIVTIANFGTETASVRVTALDAQPAVALHVPSAVAVRPGSVATLSLAGLVVPAGPVALRLAASAPVVAGATLYAAAPKAVGIATVLGLPVVPENR